MCTPWRLPASPTAHVPDEATRHCPMVFMRNISLAFESTSSQSTPRNIKGRAPSAPVRPIAPNRRNPQTTSIKTATRVSGPSGTLVVKSYCRAESRRHLRSSPGNRGGLALGTIGAMVPLPQMRPALYHVGWLTMGRPPNRKVSGRLPRGDFGIAQGALSNLHRAERGENTVPWTVGRSGQSEPTELMHRDRSTARPAQHAHEAATGS